MRAERLDCRLWAVLAIILIPAPAVSADDGTSTIATGIANGIANGPGALMTHVGDPDELPIRSRPAPAGVSPIRPNVARALQKRAWMPRSVLVPPTQELEILDPNADPTGRPAVRVSPVIGPDGQAQIEIPPTILVHRFYYTGDRSFQGPMLPGGPTVVVVNHPADGERIYLEVQMLPALPGSSIPGTRSNIIMGCNQLSFVSAHTVSPRSLTGRACRW